MPAPFRPSLKSYIDVHDFSTVAELGRYVNAVAANETLFNEYLAWKRDGPSEEFVEFWSKYIPIDSIKTGGDEHSEHLPWCQTCFLAHDVAELPADHVGSVVLEPDTSCEQWRYGVPVTSIVRGHQHYCG